MFGSFDAMMTDSNDSSGDVSPNATKLILLRTNSAIPPTRKRSLCCGETVSPSVELADNLQDLTTSSRNKWKGRRDVNQARRRLSLAPVEGPPFPERPEKKLSLDDGCFVESPATSSHSSPVSSNRSSEAVHGGDNVFFTRFTSGPGCCSLDRQSASSGVCLLPRRRNSVDDKENKISLPPSLKPNEADASCFKSPTMTPKFKKVAFRDKTNDRNMHHSVALVRCASYASTSHKNSSVLRSHESIDDGFVEQFTFEGTPTKLDFLPKNFEKLLFSPLIEHQEHETPSSSDGFFDDRSIGFARSESAKSSGRILPNSSCLFSSSRSLFSSRSSAGNGTEESASTFAISGARGFWNVATASDEKSSRLLKGSVSTTCFQERRVLRSESVDEQQLSLSHAKRRKRSVAAETRRARPFPTLTRCHSEAELSIKSALNLDEVHQDLIGDFSRKYSLPLINGKHQDLKTISSDTMASLLRNEYSQVVESFVIVDCRYPYEYRGGHIRGAINLHSTSDLVAEFFSKLLDRRRVNVDDLSVEIPSGSSEGYEGVARNIVIFHCEFSSERGPKLSRFLRNADRERNADSYPFLHYPELYLLEGGYKAFFEVHPDLCEPKGYVPMIHPDHSADLRLFRSRSSSLLSSKSLSKFLFSDC